MSKGVASDNPGEITVQVKVSATNDAEAVFVDSHFFKLEDVEKRRSIAVEVFKNNPPSRSLRNYGRKLFQALFSKYVQSSARTLLQGVITSQPTGVVLLELNGDRDLDSIP